MADSKPPVSSLSGAAGQLLLTVCGPAADSISKDIELLYQNWAWRRKNIEKIAALHHEEIQRRGLDPEKLQPLSEGDAYRTMEAASLEDEESVQKLWAGLIASAMDPYNPTKASKVFVSILQSIGSTETALLNILHKIDLYKIGVLVGVELSEKINKSGESLGDFYKKRTQAMNETLQIANGSWRQLNQEIQQDAIQNLMRLRCIGFRIEKHQSKDIVMGSSCSYPPNSVNTKADVVFAMGDYLEHLTLAAFGTAEVPASAVFNTTEFPERRYQLTVLGRSLMRACQGDSQSFGLGSDES